MYPYILIEEGKNPLFSFTTKQNINYYVSFTKIDSEKLSGIYSIDFGKIEKDKSSFDSNVKETIVEILQKFLNENPKAILHYVCDSMDGRHHFRLRLFKFWFEKFNAKNYKKLTLNYINQESDINYFLDFIFDDKFYKIEEIEEIVRNELDYYSTFK